MKKSVIIKVLIWMAFVVVYNVVLRIIAPATDSIEIQAALAQMQNTPESSAGMQWYHAFKDCSWVIYVIAAVILFSSDIVNVLKRKEIYENEDEN